MTCKAPSFLLESISFGDCSRIWTQNAITGSRMFLLFWQAVLRNAWAATTGETRSSKMSEKKQEGDEKEETELLTSTIIKNSPKFFLKRRVCNPVNKTTNLSDNPKLKYPCVTQAYIETTIITPTYSVTSTKWERHLINTITVTSRGTHGTSKLKSLTA